MPDVHPDHAALIAELRDFNDFLSDGAGEHPAPDRLLEAIVEDVAKALALAPSPRTPLPQEAKIAEKLISRLDAAIGPYAQVAEIIRAFFAECSMQEASTVEQPKSSKCSVCGFWHYCPAAAPKVEQQTPTDDITRTRDEIEDAIADALDKYVSKGELTAPVGQLAFSAAEAVYALFSSPEAPESEAL